MVGFDYAKFFDLCEINGISKQWVDTYRAVVLKDGRNWGRAYMLFRNRLAQMARVQGNLLDLAGNEVKINLFEVVSAAPVAASPDGRSAEEPPRG